MTTKRPLRTVGAVALCSVLVAVAACTNRSDDPLEYADDAMLTGADIGADDLSGVQLIGDIALVATTDHSGGRLAAIDLTTGRTIWSADDGDPILGGDSAVVDLSSPHDASKPVVRDHGGGEFEVLVPYRTTAHIEAGGMDEPVSLGVASLSGDDGRAQWLSEPLITDDDHADKLMARPVLASDDTVVAATAQRNEEGSLTTWTIDGESGSTRWTKDDVWPTALNADTVVVEPSTDVDLLYTDEGPERKENAVPRGLGAQKGESVWDLTDRFDSARVQAAAGDYAVVRADAGETTAGPSNELIEIEDGSAAEDLEDSTSCAASSTMIACAEDGQLTTADASDGGIERSSPYGSRTESSHWEIVDVFGDTVVVKDETDDNDRFQALDRAGEVRAEDMVGAPRAMTEDYLVSCAEDGAKCGFHAAESDAGLDRRTEAGAQPLTLSDPLPSSAADSTGIDSLDLRRVNGVALADESVIIAGARRAYEDPVVAAVEADTADPIWALDQSTELKTRAGQPVDPVFRLYGNPSIIEASDGFSLLMGAKSAGRSGVASMDGKTGDLESFHPLGGDDGDVDVHVSTSTHAAVEVSDKDSERTVLVDYSSPSKPKKVWTQEGVGPVSLGEDSVLVRKSSGSGAERELEEVQLLDLAKGKDVIWDSAKVRDGEHPGTVMLEAGILIVNWGDGTEIVDAASGASLGSIGKRLSQCTAEGSTVMCDSTPDPDSQRLGSPIVLERTKSGVDVTEVRNRFINGISGAYDGRFFVDVEGDVAASTDDRDEVSDSVGDAASIDTRGAVIDSDLTGRFHHVSDEGYALFMTCHPRTCTTDPSWDIRRVD